MSETAELIARLDRLEAIVVGLADQAQGSAPAKADAAAGPIFDAKAAAASARRR